MGPPVKPEDDAAFHSSVGEPFQIGLSAAGKTFLAAYAAGLRSSRNRFIR
jgi:hypothetical protein